MTPVLTANNPFAEIIFDSSLLLAAPIALLAGLVSFLSPCVLPLVPGYLGYVTGLSGVDLHERSKSRMVLGASLFVLGFSVIFVLIGAVFTYATAWLRFEGAWVVQVLGAVVMFMGLIFMGAFGFFQRERKITRRPPDGLLGAPILGATFGITYPSMEDRTGEVVMAMTDYVHPSAVPTTLVLDTQGRVSARVVGVAEPSTLRALIDTALEEDPATAAGSADSQRPGA